MSRCPVEGDAHRLEGRIREALLYMYTVCVYVLNFIVEQKETRLPTHWINDSAQGKLVRDTFKKNFDVPLKKARLSEEPGHFGKRLRYLFISVTFELGTL